MIAVFRPGAHPLGDARFAALHWVGLGPDRLFTAVQQDARSRGEAAVGGRGRHSRSHTLPEGQLERLGLFVLALGDEHEAARIHYASRRRGGILAARGARSAAGGAGGRV
jgi:hypothetical protein